MRPLHIAALAALLVTAPIFSAHAEEEESATAEEEKAESEEDYFEEIFQKFEAEALEMRENSQRDEVVLAEAEELAAVADEMRDEGDLETAISLLEEAIGLLENPSPQD
ncbi:MAG TPA: hypothetical protein VFR10_01270 [bacterium]|nr:hypothetical protein [bacterium]